MIKDRLTEEFLQGIKEIDNILLTMSFDQYFFYKKGFAYFIQYKRNDTIVEIIYGPPEFQIEIIIYTSKAKYEFKDLLEISTIGAWVSSNRYRQEDGRNIKNELLWFIELLKFSLPIIE